MGKPKASFVVACYNGQSYLTETLESIVNQNLKKIEIILVNDGSTDNTLRIMKHFEARDKRITILGVENNIGRSAARNLGIERAQSDIILISDADDISNLNRAKRTIQFFKDNPKTDIAYGGFWLIDEVSNVTAESKVIPFNWDNMLKHPMLFMGISHSTMAFRKDVFKEVQYSDGEPSKLCVDDWFFQANAYKKGFRFGAIDHPLCYYRWIPKPRDEKRILEIKKECLGLPA